MAPRISQNRAGRSAMPKFYTRTLVLALLLLACLAQAGDRVAFVRPPGYVTDDALVDYWVRVEKHPDNRWLTVGAFDGDLQVSGSQKSIDGTSPLMHRYRWRLPSGELLLVAQVYDTHGAVFRASAPVTVIRMRP